MFLLLPIGHEHREVRRLPYVSFAIVALNALAFMGTYLSTSPAQMDRASKSVRDVQDYLFQHPYLELPEEFQNKVLDADNRERLREHLEGLRDRHRAVAPEVKAREQAELDRRCAVVLKHLERYYARRWGYVPAEPRASRVLTSMFIHAGWLHLIGNMLFFYLSGPFLEDVYGRVLYPVFYLLSGVAATLTHAAEFPGSTAPLVGASGAIAGLMGAFLVRYATTRIRFAYFLLLYLRIFRGTFWAPAYVMLPLWLAQQLLEASLTGSTAGIAFWAHIGGFVFGAVVALIVRQTRLEERYIAPRIESQISVEAHPELVRAIEDRERGRLEPARARLERLLTTHAEEPEVRLQLFRACAGLGDEAAALKHAASHVSLEVRSGRLESALATFDEAEQRYPGRVWPASPSLALGRHLEKLGSYDRARELYERTAAQHAGDPAAARALTFRAQLAVQLGDAPGAVEAYGRALRIPGLDPDLARQIETRMARVAKDHGVPLPRAAGPVARGTPPPVQPPPVARRPAAAPGAPPVEVPPVQPPPRPRRPPSGS